MGNMQCPAEDAAHLASVARDICPFPDYNPGPHFFNMLSVNSSLHLSNHYRAVQSSLTPNQLEDFTQGLRTTFGREGRVTLGGVGVVALSLAVLFDTLARQVRGEWVPESGPIPGLFVKDPKGFYPQHVYTVSEYLRLVPYIANNPTMMRKESERILKDLKNDDNGVAENPREDIYGVNKALISLFENRLRIYLLKVTNSTVVKEIVTSVQKSTTMKGIPVPTGSTPEKGDDDAHVIKTRKRRIPAPEATVAFSLNCDPEAASKVFLVEVNKSNSTQEAFTRCHRRRLIKTRLHFIASLVWLDAIQDPIFNFEGDKPLLEAQREDFDLKANALRNWAE